MHKPFSYWSLILSLFCINVLLPSLSALSSEPFSIYIVKPITNENILPSSELAGSSQGNQISIQMCPGEYEPASFVIKASARVQNFTPVCSDLRNGEKLITSDNIDIKIVKCWYQGCESNSLHYIYCPGYQTGLKRVLTPELLLNDASLVTVDTQNQVNKLRVNVGGNDGYIDITKPAVNYDPKGGPDTTFPANASFDDSPVLKPVDIKVNENQQFWITAYVPPGTVPGQYEGEIALMADNLPKRSIKLKVEVLPFTLEKPILEYGLYYRGRLVSDGVERVGSEFKTEAQYRAEMFDMMKHGVESNTITQNYIPSNSGLFRKALEIRNEAGMKPVLYMLWGGLYFDDIPGRTLPLLSLAGSLGYTDVYLYGGEEMSDEEFAARRNAWTKMQLAGGKVFAGVGTTAYPLADILDLAIVCKIRSDQLGQLYHIHDHKVFSYALPQCGHEEPETYRRNYGIALWQAGYDGVMNYAYQHGWGCIWNDFDGYARDHVFAYPTTNGVVNTIQWEGFREAVDDIRYLTTLLNRIEEAKSRNVPTETVEKWASEIDTTNDLAQIRAQCTRYIIQLKDLVQNTSMGQPAGLRVVE